MSNSGHFSSPGRICKVIGMILGLIILGLESYAFDKTQDALKIHSIFDGSFNLNQDLEAILIAFTVICILETGCLLFFRVHREPVKQNKIDMIFHIFGSFALLIGAFCVFYAAIHIDTKINCIRSLLPEKECRKAFKLFHKISAASIAVLDALIYIVIAIMARKGK